MHRLRVAPLKPMLHSNMKKISKISLRILWGILADALPQVLRGENTTELENEGIDLGKKLGNEVVAAMTDNNPDDKAQINQILEENKQEIADFSLDIVEEMAKKKIQSPHSKVFVEQAIATLRQVLREEWQDNKEGQAAFGIMN